MLAVETLIVSGFKFQVSCSRRNLKRETLNLKLLQRIRLVTSQGKIFSQRVSLPIVGQKDAAQIRVIIKNHSKQIVSLSLVPICRAPNAGHARHVRVILVNQNFQTDAMELRG